MFISYSLTDDVYNSSTLKDRSVQQLHTAALSTDWFMWCLRLYQSFQSMEGYFNFSNGIGISHLAPHCSGHFKWASLCIQLRLLGTALYTHIPCQLASATVAVPAMTTSSIHISLKDSLYTSISCTVIPDSPLKCER